MSRRKSRPAPEPEEEPDEEPEAPVEGSHGAGVITLAVLGAGAAAGVYAASPEAGVLGLWAVGAGALWRSCKRRRMSDSSAPPPPPPARPSCRECAGHRLLGVAPLESQKGMLIYKTAPPDRPNHTHIHLQRTA
ncbi:hypothetical protein [Streptomyces sp. PpalLS-921]|uniref:hypothetical protein n=1 Tax=Streptomyces sp. PpalLS-921 TaxID=1839772 RepID=UPI00081E76B5|nr:hypothetical protein [Streptomyces sp. PpalLS-921]SCD61510.1 hypothetical protein GA0115249_106337 [Streptomyces sp. PpalLS-921]